ncbi:hypothetical protein ACHAXT_000562 [Thalassiosira profunda]
MSLPADAAHDWELSKENAAPLECGRSTKSLAKRAFGSSAEETKRVEEKTKKYERLVKRSEKAVEWMQRQSKAVVDREGGAERELTEVEGQELRQRMVAELGFDPATADRDHVDYDPLRYWVLYIKHIRESYPSDSQRQFLLMERCARTFTSRPFIAPAYQNDVRFVRTCILYADKTSNPSEVFKMMSKIKVGTKVSLFWVAWAWVAEKGGDFPFTEKIFQKALSVGAEPRKFLEERQRQFLRRMSRHWLNASQAQEGLDDEEGDEDGRGALNSLSSRGVARNDRRGAERRHGQQQQQQQQQESGFSRASSRQGQSENKPAASTGGFAIFQDGDDQSDVFDDENAPGGRRLAKESERTKENNQRPEQWNERGYGLVNPPGSSAAPPVGSDSIVGTTARDYGRPPAHGLPRSGSSAAFDVFVDEEFVDDDAAPVGKSEKPTDQRSLRQVLDGGTADRLTRDPLRYMKNPAKLESDQAKYDARPADAGESAEEKASTGGSRIQRPDPKGSKPAPKEKKASGYGFDRRLLKEDSNGDECCFAERRAMDGHYKRKLVSPSENFSLLLTSIKESSSMDVSESMTADESIEEVDMEKDTEDLDMEKVAQVTSCKPAKSVLKSSLRHGGTASKATVEDQPSSAMNPRRVLFGTNVVYTNESVNTSNASSQLNGSFVKPEETINTRLANAEISMMFSSPNANASRAETPGKSLFDEEPLFSTTGKKGHARTSFVIHDENKPEPDGGHAKASDNGLSFAIHDQNKPESKGPAFSIYGDDDRNKDSESRAPEKRTSGEDTASLSVIGDVMGSLQNCSVKEAPKAPSAGLGFEIFSDEASAQKKPKIGEPCFDVDISRIEDEKTSNFEILDENAVATNKHRQEAIDYTPHHKEDVEGAMRQCLRAARGNDQAVFDYRRKPMPKALLRKSFTGGTEIDLLSTRCTIEGELGRGVYGVVILCSDEEGQSYALKIQAPIGSLAHEYSVLSRLEERVEPAVSGFYPFPRSRALYAFSEGGLFSMTAASNSGMTLIDAVNTCKKAVGNVPELVAIYYTSRMLKHLESLHQDGQVLHCDVKPDNWVLTSSPKGRDYAGANAVGGVDLMLVDFGRSVDLETVDGQGSDPLRTQFKGSVAAEDMECASMRKELPWGVDLDFFGLAASSFLLLFGSHMDVVEDKRSGKWRLHKSLRRYWQRDLWSSLFDSLLNFDSTKDKYCLRDIRKSFDEYIDGNQRRQEIATHLNQLYTHLPKKR